MVRQCLGQLLAHVGPRLGPLESLSTSMGTSMGMHEHDTEHDMASVDPGVIAFSIVFLNLDLRTLTATLC